jgi:hypothetical protein
VGKYDPLRTFLQDQKTERLPVNFAEIEAVLGFRLPASKQYPAWWSNSPTNNPMTKVWLEAGYMTEQVDTAAERLVFRRATSSPPSSGGMPAAPSGGVIAALRAALQGTVRFAPGFDPAEPTGETWDAERE